MPDLITLAEAKALARVDFNDDDTLLSFLIEASSEAVLSYLKSQGQASFYDGTALTSVVPAAVKVATAYLVREYYDDGFDDMTKAFTPYGGLPDPVVALLYRLRDPALA